MLSGALKGAYDQLIQNDAFGDDFLLHGMEKFSDMKEDELTVEFVKFNGKIGDKINQCDMQTKAMQAMYKARKKALAA